jgi:hypothetical protein
VGVTSAAGSRVAVAAWVAAALVWPAVAALVYGGSPAGAAWAVAVLAVAAVVVVGAAGPVGTAPVRLAGVLARAAVPVPVRQRDPDTAGRPRPRAPGRGGPRPA